MVKDLDDGEARWTIRCASRSKESAYGCIGTGNVDQQARS